VIGSGGVAAASADGRSNVQAASVNNGVALAAAAGASNASATTTTPPTCSGPGLALATRSDGAFCVDVLGFVATG
jgi:aspartate oxidase